MRRTTPQKLMLAIALLATSFVSADAQQTPPNCVQWKTYTDTVWVEQDVTENRVVHETSYETKEIAKSRPRWVSEERERTITEEKPVQQTSERVVTRTVRKPVTTTKTRIKTRVEESWEEVTEMRDETYTVRKPVVETVMETKEVLVRKPVTRRMVEKESVTVYRPQTTTSTVLTPGAISVPAYSSSNRPRMKWLQRGYYGDPFTGQPVWRRGGLHWVQEPQMASVPVVVPQEQTSTTMVPETVVKEKPIEVTRYVDEYETRKVPVEVERMVEETRTRRVPYKVRIPKKKLIEEEIPYTETTYVDETITERIPVTETVMKQVTRREPYTVVKQSWQDYTETVRVPTTTTRRVPYVSKYRVPYLVQVRVPCDEFGRPVARGQQVSGTHRLHPAWKQMMTKVVGATETTGIESAPAASSVLSNRRNSDSLGAAPRNLRFPDDSNSVLVTETSGRMQPIRRTPQSPVSAEPEETEASKELSRRIKERFDNLGIVSQEQPESESVLTRETSGRTENRAAQEADPEPAKADFEPEKLSIDVDVPPSADQPGSASPDAESTDDDTIEQDVDVSRNRS